MKYLRFIAALAAASMFFACNQNTDINNEEKGEGEEQKEEEQEIPHPEVQALFDELSATAGLITYDDIVIEEKWYYYYSGEPSFYFLDFNLPIDLDCRIMFEDIKPVPPTERIIPDGYYCDSWFSDEEYLIAQINTAGQKFGRIALKVEGHTYTICAEVCNSENDHVEKVVKFTSTGNTFKPYIQMDEDYTFPSTTAVYATLAQYNANYDDITIELNSANLAGKIGMFTRLWFFLPHKNRQTIDDVAGEYNAGTSAGNHIWRYNNDEFNFVIEVYSPYLEKGQILFSANLLNQKLSIVNVSGTGLVLDGDINGVIGVGNSYLPITVHIDNLPIPLEL